MVSVGEHALIEEEPVQIRRGYKEAVLRGGFSYAYSSLAHRRRWAFSCPEGGAHASGQARERRERPVQVGEMGRDHHRTRLRAVGRARARLFATKSAKGTLGRAGSMGSHLSDSFVSQRDATPLTHASRGMWHARLATAPLVRLILPHTLSKGKTTIDNSLHVGKQILHKIEFILKKYE